MREAAQGGGEMAPPELVRTFYETVVSQHRLEDLPRFVGEGCVLRQGAVSTGDAPPILFLFLTKRECAAPGGREKIAFGRNFAHSCKVAVRGSA